MIHAPIINVPMFVSVSCLLGLKVEKSMLGNNVKVAIPSLEKFLLRNIVIK